MGAFDVVETHCLLITSQMLYSLHHATHTDVISCIINCLTCNLAMMTDYMYMDYSS